MSKNQNGGASNGNSSDKNKMNVPMDSKQAIVFAAKQQYRQLTRRSLEPAASVSFSELVQCACFPLAAKSRKLMPVISNDLSLYTQYEWILRKMNIAQSLEQVAASSELKQMSRSTEKFDLQIKPDKSNSRQAHLLLSLKESNARDTAYPKGIFLHCVAKNEFELLHFENVLDGQAQLIIEKESRTFELLSSANTKLYLC
jgi:hypothetical protein